MPERAKWLNKYDVGNEYGVAAAWHGSFECEEHSEWLILRMIFHLKLIFTEQRLDKER